MGTDQPERPAGEDERLWVDPEWWKDVLRPDGSARAGDPLTDPLPLEVRGAAGPAGSAASTGPLVEPVPGGGPVAPDEQLLAAPPLAPPGTPGTDVGAAPPQSSAPGRPSPATTSTGSPAPPAVPRRRDLHVPGEETSADPPLTKAPQAETAVAPGSLPAAQLPAAVRPARRSVGDVVGSRLADAGLLLLALAVIALVYLALTR